MLIANTIVVFWFLKPPKVLTPEEEIAEKLKQRKLQEDSDLQLAKEAFGIQGIISLLLRCSK